MINPIWLYKVLLISSGDRLAIVWGTNEEIEQVKEKQTACNLNYKYKQLCKNKTIVNSVKRCDKFYKSYAKKVGYDGLQRVKTCNAKHMLKSGFEFII